MGRGSGSRRKWDRPGFESRPHTCCICDLGKVCLSLRILLCKKGKTAVRARRWEQEQSLERSSTFTATLTHPSLGSRQHLTLQVREGGPPRAGSKPRAQHASRSPSTCVLPHWPSTSRTTLLGGAAWPGNTTASVNLSAHSSGAKAPTRA